MKKHRNGAATFFVAIAILLADMLVQPAHIVYLPFISGGIAVISPGPGIIPTPLAPGPRGCLFVCGR